MPRLRDLMIAALVLGCGLLLTRGATAAPWAQAAPDDAATVASALDRRFTYQGRLSNGASLVNGTCDLRFYLYAAASGGNQVGAQQVVSNVPVSDGLFVVTLNEANQFGDGAFTGEQRWLEVGVRCPTGSGEFMPLNPRQALDVTPYAVHAMSAHTVPWSGVTGVPDAVASPPTYTAGAGLQLNGGEFQVVFYGDGTATSAAHSDHTHFGQEWNGEKTGPGLYISNSASTAIYGSTTSTAGNGVQGVSTSAFGVGVLGTNSSQSGHAHGVEGRSSTTSGSAVYGWATATTGTARGVEGRSMASQGTAVAGWADAPTGNTIGVGGWNVSPTGIGIQGKATADSGNTIGVKGQVESPKGRAIVGYVLAGGNEVNYAVFGESNSMVGRGVAGFATAMTGINYGVVGQSNSIAGRGVYGRTTSDTGTTFAIFGLADSPAGFAGYFNGKLSATGVKTFRIDHPVYPMTMTLSHAAVESSEQLNVYSGNVVLDGYGVAQVDLPTWFTALNTDIRYQLTPIGAAMPNMHIAVEVDVVQGNNWFRIAGGEPNGKVSWLVSGVRHDPTADYYPLVVEEIKPEEEQGTYLTPKAFDRPAEEGTHYDEPRLAPEEP